MTRSKLPLFPQDGLKFLKSLRRNNHREWFLKHKETYEEYVRNPMIALVEALAVEMATFAPEIVANPKTSLYRIYRDTRFSKDKTPYKTHTAASFPLRGVERHQGAGFYFHISPTEFFIGGGLYSPQPDDLAAVREHIAVNFKKLDSIVSARSFRRMFGELSGEQLQRVPRGFPADHPAAGYLRRKQFLAARTLPPEIVTTSKFSDVILESFRTLHPLIRFLNEPILRAHLTQQRRAELMR